MRSAVVCLCKFGGVRVVLFGLVSGSFLVPALCSYGEMGRVLRCRRSCARVGSGLRVVPFGLVLGSFLVPALCWYGEMGRALRCRPLVARAVRRQSCGGVRSEGGCGAWGFGCYSPMEKPASTSARE